MLLDGGLVTGVARLLLLVSPGATARFHIDSSEEARGGMDVGRSTAFTVAAPIVDTPVTIEGGTQASGDDTKGINVAGSVRIGPTSTGGEFDGGENARDEGRRILESEE